MNNYETFRQNTTGTINPIAYTERMYSGWLITVYDRVGFSKARGLVSALTHSSKRKKSVPFHYGTFTGTLTIREVSYRMGEVDRDLVALNTHLVLTADEENSYLAAKLKSELAHGRSLPNFIIEDGEITRVEFVISLGEREHK